MSKKRPTINVELLASVLAYIERHPQEHKQQNWGERGTSCGTTFCFAGTAALMDGATLLWGKESAANSRELLYGVMDYSGQVTSVEKYARHELGLTTDEADTLFGGYISLDDIRSYVAMLTKEQRRRDKKAAKKAAKGLAALDLI
jgi:hypothetical protein